MKGDRLIRLAMIAAVSGVAAVAAWVSYFHAVAVVEHYGAESATTAHLMPVCTDGLIVAGSMVLLHCARAGIRAPLRARAALGLGIAATLVLNISHGLSKGGPAALIAGWPAVALVVSYELLMWLVRQTSDIVTSDAPRRPNEADKTSDDDITVARPGTEPMSDDAALATTSNGHVDRRSQALALLASTPDISGSELGRQLGVSERQGLRLLRSLAPHHRGEVEADAEEDPRVDGPEPHRV